IWRQAVSGDRIESINSIGTVLMPITYVWRIATPERLIRLTTVGGDTLVLTPETKIQAMKDARFDWMEASVLAAGDFVTVMKNNGRLMMLQSVESITEGLPEYVYDLTVDPAHSFLGSGFIIHNTAAAVKDDFGDGRWTLEAGALVLADKGLACIDELDKMTDHDKSSLHEAMESQRISVAKAGITATLQCRCSMLAAANPKLGRFDMDVKIAEQINLPPALMSRFDLMFVLTDKPDAKLDRNIATHILDGHLRGQARVQKAPVDGVDIDGILEHTSNIIPPYSVDILRKYVAYAKKNYVPVMTQEAYDLIRDDYLRIRLSSKDGSIPITARQLEAYIRLAEASAKMHLRNTVTKDDARRSIELIEYYLKKIASTGDSFDIDLAGGSFSNSERKRSREIIYNEIKNAVGGISMEQLKQICANEGISGNTVETVVEMLRDNMDVVATRGLYRLLESGN
ncbi:MAG: ATP-binding protein, partial [Candidatus Methanomethylophilaceae archaeon]|nr:ATP-binding protein [Candidatus Methanomethylophilaceae archaeon]